MALLFVSHNVMFLCMVFELDLPPVKNVHFPLFLPPSRPGSNASFAMKLFLTGEPQTGLPPTLPSKILQTPVAILLPWWKVLPPGAPQKFWRQVGKELILFKTRFEEDRELSVSNRHLLRGEGQGHQKLSEEKGRHSGTTVRKKSLTRFNSK